MRIIRGDKDPNSCFIESNYGLLLFDTGAATSQLIRSPLTDGLKKLNSVNSRGLLGEITQDMVSVNELIAGDIQAEELTVTLDGSVGILGLDVLKNYCFSFDVKNNEINLIDRFTSEIPCYFGQRNHIYVKAKINGCEFWAMVDTGAGMSLIDERLCRKLIDDKSVYRTESGEDWTGAAFEVRIATIGSLTIGNSSFPPHEFALMDLSNFPSDNGYSVSAIIGATTLLERRFGFNLVDGYIAID